MRDKCDKCLEKILYGRCKCGYWLTKEEQPELLKTLEKAIYAYDHICEQSNCESPLSADHHSGNCIVLFKGSYEDVGKVRKFILELNDL